MAITQVKEFFGRFEIDWKRAPAMNECSHLSKIVISSMSHLRELDRGPGGMDTDSAIEKLRCEMVEWCEQNCSGEYMRISEWRAYGFVNDTDAMLFELRWG